MRRIARVMKARPFSYEWLAARIESVTLRRAGGAICISRYVQAEVQHRLPRTWVVPNAVESAFFHVANRPESPPMILCVATVHIVKNQNELIRALDPVAASRGIRLVFIGHVNPNERYGREFLELVRSRSWCSFVGPTGRDTVREYLARASLLVLPSIEENCPLVLLEAMAAGVPVVASRVGGIPDLVEEGRTGWFCVPDQRTSIREAVSMALEQPALARKVAESARNRVHEFHRSDPVARRHVEVYREFLGTLRCPATAAERMAHQTNEQPS